MALTKLSLTFLILIAAAAISSNELVAQIGYVHSPKLNAAPGSVTSLPPSNSVSHITVQGNTIWIGTGKGLARSLNGGRSWESFRSVPQFVRTGIFAVAVKGDTVWSSMGFTKDVEDQRVQTGDGYAFSTNNGTTWNYVPQTLDGRGDSLVNYGSNVVSFLPIVVNEQNVTFDVALSDSAVWIASWSSGLRKSTDLGQTWQRIVLPSANRNSIRPGDSLGRYVIDPRRDNNYLLFSVFVENDSTIWAGSAGGVNKSTDAGRSWTKFTTLNQQSPILGNWVIAVAAQKLAAHTRIWTTNWRADLDPNEQFGVSFTDDGGIIWKNFLHGIRAYDFAFKDSITYIATEEGIYRSDDGGLSWIRSGTIIDPISGHCITCTAFFAVSVVGDTVYGVGSDGMVKTIDNDSHSFGQTWEILRTYRPVGNMSTTYAYPNPFSPSQACPACRIHYSTGGKPANVTIEVFDFGMNRVRTVIKDAPRSGTIEHDEIWDGLDDNKRRVANGVYFYRVIVDGGEPSWGKVMVLQ